MSDTDTPGNDAANGARKEASPRQWSALLDIADQQIALEDHEPPLRVTLRVVGDGPSVNIPCANGGGCMWAHDGAGGVGCQTDGCGAWARPGHELFDKVLAVIGPAT